MKKNIRVVLTNDVPSLGKQGDICEVTFGHAKNFLFPRGFAVPATAAATKQAELLVQRRGKEAADADARRQIFAKQLRNIHLVLSAKANANGTLYGGVHAEDILLALRSAGVEGVPASAISFDKPVHAIGESSVVIHLDSSEKIIVPLTITAKE